MEKNQQFQGVVTGLTSEGMGVTHAEGMAVFVPSVCPGDEITFQIVKVNHSYAFGRRIALITPSPDRVAEDCPAFPRCGGCVYRQLSYPAECAEKQKNAEENFRKLGHLTVTAEKMLCDTPLRYRNKGIFPVAEENGHLVSGFYAPRSHRVIPVADCLLHPVSFGPVIQKVLTFGDRVGWKPFDPKTGKGQLRHLFLRSGFSSGELLLTLIVPSFALPGIRELAEELLATVQGLVGVVLNENKRRDNVLLGERFLTVAGKGTMNDRLCGLDFSISPRSFYQVNPVMAEKLYETAGAFLALQGSETLLDLYCGAGTIGLSLAGQVKRVIGVELIPEAIENAKENAARNQIENAEFLCADAGQAAEELVSRGLRPDAVLVDPPRKGCDPPCLNAILKMAPEKICYISCNPATAARDIAYLSENGYQPARFAVADLFPRTAHVETVCLLVQQKEKAENGVAAGVHDDGNDANNV